MADALAVFTMEPPELILSQGGTQEWKVREPNARRCEYVICVQNQSGHYRDWACRPTQPHRAAFLIGRIVGLVQTRESRYLIRISDYSRIFIPNFWPGGQMPVRYMSMDQTGIDLNTLAFTPVGQSPSPPGQQNVEQGVSDDEREMRPLTLAQAKRGLAATFGVNPDAIEITIRG